MPEVSMGLYVQQPCVIYKILPITNHLPDLVFTVFLVSGLHESLNLEGQSIIKALPFRTEFSIVSHSLHVVQSWVSVLIAIYCMKKFLSEWLSDALIYGNNNVPLGVILLLCSFTRIIVIGFLLEP